MLPLPLMSSQMHFSIATVLYYSPSRWLPWRKTKHWFLTLDCEHDLLWPPACTCNRVGGYAPVCTLIATAHILDVEIAWGGHTQPAGGADVQGVPVACPGDLRHWNGGVGGAAEDSCSALVSSGVLWLHSETSWNPCGGQRSVLKQEACIYVYYGLPCILCSTS